MTFHIQGLELEAFALDKGAAKTRLRIKLAHREAIPANIVGEVVLETQFGSSMQKIDELTFEPYQTFFLHQGWRLTENALLPTAGLARPLSKQVQADLREVAKDF